MIYRFKVPVCGYRVYEVEADTEEEARRLILDENYAPFESNIEEPRAEATLLDVFKSWFM